MLRIAGKQNLYIDILLKFQANYTDFIQKTENLILEGDLQTLKRQFHTLKGVAGNIGANDIQFIAQLLESKLQSGEDILKLEELKSLKYKLATAINEISLLENHNNETDTTILNMEELLPKLNELNNLLEDYDAAAEDIIKGIKATLIDLGYEIQAEELYIHIKNYDFDSALKICKAVIENLER